MMMVVMVLMFMTCLVSTCSAALSASPGRGPWARGGGGGRAGRRVGGWVIMCNWVKGLWVGLGNCEGGVHQRAGLGAHDSGRVEAEDDRPPMQVRGVAAAAGVSGRGACGVRVAVIPAP